MGLADRERVIQCLENVGVYINQDLIKDDLFIVDYIEDSIVYISFIVELEEMFNFEMPDEYLVTGEMETINDFCSTINMILQKQARAGNIK